MRWIFAIGTGLMLLAGSISCGSGGRHSTGTSSAVSDLIPTLVPPDIRLLSKLIADPSVPFRVEFKMTLQDASQGSVVWRQSNGARRFDYWVSGQSRTGGFAIDVDFNERFNFPGSLFDCNWVPRDADLLAVECTDPGAGLPARQQFLGGFTHGLLDRQLPERSVLGISVRCYGIEHSITAGGEICVDPATRIPLYYASDSGTVLEALTYTTDATASAFTPDLVLRLDWKSDVLSLPSGQLEVPLLRSP